MAHYDAGRWGHPRHQQSPFSEALNQELRGKDVTSTLPAPEFAAHMDLSGTKLISGGGKTPASVAEDRDGAW
jgi:hypothetical protein